MQAPRLYAYTLATRDRDPDRDFDTLREAGNHNPTALWSDGTTMWVADQNGTIYAYNLATRSRDPAKDVLTGRRGLGVVAWWSLV